MKYLAFAAFASIVYAMGVTSAAPGPDTSEYLYTPDTTTERITHEQVDAALQRSLNN